MARTHKGNTMSALTLRDYVEMVLEGYTLHPGARKILDTAIAQELASQTASTNPVVSQKAAGTVDKDCGNCKKFSTNSLTGGPVCISCKDYSNWEPKP